MTSYLEEGCQKASLEESRPISLSALAPEKLCVLPAIGVAATTIVIVATVSRQWQSSLFLHQYRYLERAHNLGPYRIYPLPLPGLHQEALASLEEDGRLVGTLMDALEANAITGAIDKLNFSSVKGDMPAGVEAEDCMKATINDVICPFDGEQGCQAADSLPADSLPAVLHAAPSCDCKVADIGWLMCVSCIVHSPSSALCFRAGVEALTCTSSFPIRTRALRTEHAMIKCSATVPSSLS